MTTTPQEPGTPDEASDRLDPEIPNPDVPVEHEGDPDAVPADPDVEPTAEPDTANADANSDREA